MHYRLPTAPEQPAQPAEQRASSPTQPEPPTQPKQNYVIDVDMGKTSGAVVETTGKKTKPDIKTGVPSGVDITGGEIKIGERTFVRLGSTLAKGVTFSLREKYVRSGIAYEEDYCRDKQPGPPLGQEPEASGAPDHELPQAVIKLETFVPLEGGGR
jgi:hypothetical protein